MAKTKTMTQHIETGIKYSGGSLTLAAALAGILVWYFPEMKEIEGNMVAIFGLLSNLVLITFFKK